MHYTSAVHGYLASAVYLLLVLMLLDLLTLCAFDCNFEGLETCFWVRLLMVDSNFRQAESILSKKSEGELWSSETTGKLINSVSCDFTSLIQSRKVWLLAVANTSLSILYFAPFLCFFITFSVYLIAVLGSKMRSLTLCVFGRSLDSFSMSARFRFDLVLCKYLIGIILLRVSKDNWSGALGFL